MNRVARVLVVDDLPENGRLLEAMLIPHGFSVTVAQSGEEGLEKVRTAQPDIMLLDILMPEMTGYDVCRRVREDQSTRFLPIIMLTSSSDQDKVDAIDAGADDFIPRPLNPKELVSRVRSLLRIKEYRDIIEAQATELAQWNRTLEGRIEDQLAQIDGLDRLRRFFSKPVADVILSGGDEMLEPHRRDVTIVVCNLKGYRAFSAGAEPEDVMRVLSDFYATVGELALRYEATLDQFAGDSVITIFNDPIPCEEHTADAVRMAVSVRVRAVTLVSGWRARGFDLDVGIGVAEGFATLGRVGFEGRFDYRATGTVVELALGLGTRALGGQLLLSPRAHAGVLGLVDVEAADPIELEGFPDAVCAFNVVGLRALTEGAMQPADVPGELPNSFIAEGDFWSLTYAGVLVRVKDSKGLRDIARLLETPGREIMAVDLARGAGPPPAMTSTTPGPGFGFETGVGELLDANARAQYRARLVELEEEIVAADTNNDPERASLAREEREFLVLELRAAVGLGGHPRRAPAPTERARKAVTGRVLDAIARIDRVHAPLGRHLRRSIRTGSYCMYDPVEVAVWRVVTEFAPTIP